MSLLVDAHAHPGSHGEKDARRNVLTVLCGTEPVSALEALAQRNARTVACCGLHPWQVANWRVEDMMPFMLECPVIGEIGLDCVWADVDMQLQRAAFHQQLEIAGALGKPIVLHTKGMEREIAETMKPFSVRKLVHWYSEDAHLGLYLDQDCYFTVGPDYATNPAVRQVIRQIPLNRLLTETDGMSAVSWAYGYAVAPEAVEDVLRGELRAIAEAKGIGEAEAQDAVHENLMRFLSM